MSGQLGRRGFSARLSRGPTRHFEKMQREDEEFDLYEGLEFLPPVAANPPSRQKGTSASPSPARPSGGKAPLPPSSPKQFEANSVETGVQESLASLAATKGDTEKPSNTTAPSGAAEEDSDEDNLVFLGAEEDIQLPEVSDALQQGPPSQVRKLLPSFFIPSGSFSFALCETPLFGLLERGALSKSGLSFSSEPKASLRRSRGGFSRFAFHSKRSVPKGEL